MTPGTPLGPPQAFPSRELSDYPRDEVRSAVIPDTDGVEVFYRHTYADGQVDVIAVR